MTESPPQPPSPARRYLVAFQLTSGARLAQHPMGPPEAWQLAFEGPDTSRVTILDLFKDSDTGSFSFGFGIEVEVDAASLDEAVNEALWRATFTATTLSATSRAPVGRPDPVIAFEIEPSDGKRICVGGSGTCHSQVRLAESIARCSPG